MSFNPLTPEAALADTLLQCASTILERSKVALTVADKLAEAAFDDASFSTAALAAELLRVSLRTLPLSADAHDEILRSLQTYIFTALEQADVNDWSRVYSVVKICQRCPVLTNNLIQYCAQKLHHEVRALGDIPDGFVVPALPSLDGVLENESIVGFIQHNIEHNIDVFCCLNFLKVLVRTAAFPSSIPWITAYLLLVLIGARDARLTTCCTTSLAAIAVRSFEHVEQRNASRTTEIHRFCEVAWSRVLQLIHNPVDIQASNSGFALWSSLINSSGKLFLTRALLAGGEYWTALQNGLAYGTAQHRKSCLFILKLSLANIQSDIDCASMTVKVSQLRELKQQYARYATLFETIVLARYLNQVQDCLPDLTIISQPHSQVTGTWIVVLVHAALAHGMQDSIRKLIGNWIMEHGVRVLQQGIFKAPEFLEKCFLPWASLGSHFTTTVDYNRSRTPISRHGERLCKFLTRFLVSNMDDQTRNSLVKAILEFLVAKTGRIYQFARAFILESLVKAVNSANHRIDEEVVILILQCSNIAGFQEMVRDLMILQCGALLKAADHVSTIDQNTRPLLRACTLLQETHEFDDDYSQAVHHFESILIEFGIQFNQGKSESLHGKILPKVSLSSLYICVARSHSRSLSGPGLKAACICFFEALEHENGEEIDAKKLRFVLSSIWDEVEIQEHPKQILMMIPRIFLHETCVKLCSTSPELKSLISEVALEVQQLAEYKVYAFSPLASALRNCLVNMADAVELPVVDLISNFVTHPTTTKVEFQLEDAISPRLETYAPHRNYSAYYGEKEAYGHACVFDTLNRMPGAWVGIRRQIIETIMKPWIHQKEPVAIFSAWKSSAQIQAVLILFDGLIPHLSDEEIQHHLQAYRHIMSLEPMPRFRHLWEWIIARIYMLKPNFRPGVLEELGKADLSNPKYVVSLQKIALTIARLPDSNETFALDLMTTLMPLAASPKIAVRHEAHWTVPALWEHCEMQTWKSVTENPAYVRLNYFIRSLDVYKTPPPGRLLENLDLVSDHTLAGIFQGSYLRIEPIEDQKVLRSDFIALYTREGISMVENADFERLGLIPLGEEPKDSQFTTLQILSSLYAAKESIVPDQIPVPLQTKASTWQDGVVGSLDMETPGGNRRVRDVIVVSSLIDNAYNIGGLSRVGEIFGIKSLQIASLNVIKNRDFTSVSVSSHLWLPIEELEVDAVPEFLLQRKLEGYTIIGIEQTDSSKVLGSDQCKFPERSVLVLGGEREGISARLLAEMDFCVEIKQIGITRSMNVQTAAAVVLYEYSRQHP